MKSSFARHSTLLLLQTAGYVISDTAFDASLRADAGIALAAVSYDGCALKHVAPQLRSMAIIGYGDYGDWQSKICP